MSNPSSYWNVQRRQLLKELNECAWTQKGSLLNKQGYIELPNGHWRAEDWHIRAVCSRISLLLRSVSATFPKFGSIVTYAHFRQITAMLEYFFSICFWGMEYFETPFCGENSLIHRACVVWLSSVGFQVYRVTRLDSSESVDAHNIDVSSPPSEDRLTMSCAT